MAPARITGVVDHGEAAENVFAEAAGADGGGDGGQADGDHDCHADSGDDYAESQRELHLP